MRGRILRAISIVFAIGLLNGGLSHAQTNKPVLIGVHLDQAKQASYYSLLQKDAIDLFIKEFNAAGGVLGRQSKCSTKTTRIIR